MTIELKPAAINMIPLTGLYLGVSKDFMSVVTKQARLKTPITLTQIHRCEYSGVHAKL